MGTRHKLEGRVRFLVRYGSNHFGVPSYLVEEKNVLSHIRNEYVFRVIEGRQGMAIVKWRWWCLERRGLWAGFPKALSRRLQLEMLILKNTCASILTMLADIQTSVKHSYIVIKVIIKAFDTGMGFIITDKSMIDSIKSSLHFSLGLVRCEQA